MQTATVQSIITSYAHGRRPSQHLHREELVQLLFIVRKTYTSYLHKPHDTMHQNIDLKGEVSYMHAR